MVGEGERSLPGIPRSGFVRLPVEGLSKLSRRLLAGLRTCRNCGCWCGELLLLLLLPLAKDTERHCEAEGTAGDASVAAVEFGNVAVMSVDWMIESMLVLLGRVWGNPMRLQFNLNSLNSIIWCVGFRSNGLGVRCEFILIPRLNTSEHRKNGWSRMRWSITLSSSFHILLQGEEKLLQFNLLLV